MSPEKVSTDDNDFGRQYITTKALKQLLPMSHIAVYAIENTHIIVEPEDTPKWDLRHHMRNPGSSTKSLMCKLRVSV